ncbi:MAG: sodium:solute symporter family protein, partial [Deltaproteobacteria bacterium]
MSRLGWIGIVLLAYLAVVAVIGGMAARRTAGDPEDYFLGGRAARTLVLFMALFGTNVTPFVLMGIPGLAYHHGVGVYGMNAAIVALGIPLTFWLIGDPARVAARRLGAITPAELYAGLLGARSVGVSMFVLFFVFTIPYMVTAVLGVGLAVDVLTDGQVPFAVAAAGIVLVTLAYTTAGGMRATMWTNVFQGATFMAFVLVAFGIVTVRHGGVAALVERTAASVPDLLVKGARPLYAPGRWNSWALAISLTVIAFPHMLVRIFAARDSRTLKRSSMLYPAALALLWLPVVALGVFGAVLVPGLEGKASDRVLPLLMRRELPAILQGVGLAGICAAVMSTLDAQLLTLSSMLGRDVLRVVRPELDPRTEVRLGRLFVLGLSGLVYVLVLARPASIFDIAAFAFSGYVMLVPTLYLALAWRRFSAFGALASMWTGVVVLGLAMLPDAPPAG